MKTKTIELFEYSELSDEAKQKALSDWNEHNDNPLMQSHMINLLKEKLEERNIRYDANSIDVRYSLSHCQGDGFMFEGKLYWEGVVVRIKHSGHYYHSNSKDVQFYTGDETESLYSHTIADKFEKVYQEICKEMEQIGYDEIEYDRSAENFESVCEANEYYFTKEGKLNQF